MNKIGRPKGEVERKQIGIHMDVDLWFKFKADCALKGVVASYQIENLVKDYLGDSIHQALTTY